MWIRIFHSDDHPATAFVAERDDISENALAAVFGFHFVTAVIGHIPLFTFLELHVVFRFTHLLQLCYGVSFHSFRFSAHKVTTFFKSS